MISRELSVLVGTALLLAATGCSSSSSDGGGGAAGSGGAGTATASGPVAGDSDTHCKGKSVVVDPAACKTMGKGGAGGMGGGGGAGGGSAGEAGAGGNAAAGAPGTPTSGANGDCPSVDPDYGDIAYGSEADDDDCKYHVKWSVTPFQVGTAASFTVTVTTIADGKPATGLAPRAEVFIPCELTHVPPKVDFAAAATETGPGTYQIGPMTFDKATHWAVRFHFSETCDDSETSPHGHAAFYLAVP
jgi:hypothetical protein